MRFLFNYKYYTIHEKMLNVFEIKFTFKNVKIITHVPNEMN